MFAIPWFSLNFLLFYYPGGRTHGSGVAKQTLSCYALLRKPKSGTFSLREKSGPPPRPRRYFRAAEIRYLARKQSARDKSILLFRLRRKFVALDELGR